MIGRLDSSKWLVGLVLICLMGGCGGSSSSGSATEFNNSVAPAQTPPIVLRFNFVLTREVGPNVASFRVVLFSADGMQVFSHDQDRTSSFEVAVPGFLGRLANIGRLFYLDDQGNVVGVGRIDLPDFQEALDQGRPVEVVEINDPPFEDINGVIDSLVISPSTAELVFPTGPLSAQFAVQARFTDSPDLQDISDLVTFEVTTENGSPNGLVLDPSVEITLFPQGVAFTASALGTYTVTASLDTVSEIATVRVVGPNTVRIEPGTNTMALGESRTFTATLIKEDGTTEPLPASVLQFTGALSGTLDAGVGMAVRTGQGSVVVQTGDAQGAELVIEVQVGSIEVIPNTDLIFVDETAFVTCVNRIGAQSFDISHLFVFFVATGQQFISNEDGAVQQAVTGLAEGVGTVSAQPQIADPLLTPSKVATIQVIDPGAGIFLTGIEVNPNTFNVAPGNPFQLQVTGLVEGGGTINLTNQTTFLSTDEQVVSFPTTPGTAQANAEGSAQAVACFEVLRTPDGRFFIPPAFTQTNLTVPTVEVLANDADGIVDVGGGVVFKMVDVAAATVAPDDAIVVNIADQATSIISTFSPFTPGDSMPTRTNSISPNTPGFVTTDAANDSFYIPSTTDSEIQVYSPLNNPMLTRAFNIGVTNTPVGTALDAANDRLYVSTMTPPAFERYDNVSGLFGTVTPTATLFVAGTTYSDIVYHPGADALLALDPTFQQVHGFLNISAKADLATITPDTILGSSAIDTPNGLFLAGNRLFIAQNGGVVTFDDPLTAGTGPPTQVINTGGNPRDVVVVGNQMFLSQGAFLQVFNDVFNSPTAGGALGGSQSGLTAPGSFSAARTR